MRRTLPVLILTCINSICYASIDKIYSPTVEQGELEIEVRGVYVLDGNSADGDQAHKFAVGYGVNSFWFVEGYVEVEKKQGDSAEIEAFELENRFQFSEPGEYAVNFGGLLEVEKSRELDLWEIKVGPLLQKDFGRWTGTTNLLFEWQFGDDKTENEWEFIGRVQMKYRLNETFEPGIEYHTEENTKAVGIVGMGSIKFGDTPVKWLAGLIFGLDDNTPDTMLRWELELEF